MTEHEEPQPVSDPETLLHLKDEMMACWQRLPVEHQATMGLVLFKDVLESVYGDWTIEALQISGEEVSDVDNQDSRMVRAGSRTYFMDLKRTEEGKGYLVITESRFQGEGKGRKRQRIFLFEDSASEFLNAVSELVGRM